jgi:hypothetical protein
LDLFGLARLHRGLDVCLQLVDDCHEVRVMPGSGVALD